MKKLMAITLLALSTLASADAIKLLDIPNYKLHNREINMSFNVNKNLGRAWVEINLEGKTDENPGDELIRINIDGLSYNHNTREIILKKEGQEIVCAKAVMFFRSNLIYNIRNTGACNFSQNYYSKKVDDGFYIYKLYGVQLFLNY